ncbi:MAG: UDP-N-acetylmuramoyl-L-alanine--D-glutamate ligase [Gammaproteobacteria bacterium]|nr:UDP-N-acetylmuramoyl-L-alanine--D-glutamate ligase [Gammaproteobacteria bacterium]
MRIEDLKNKKTAVYGYGREGRSMLKLLKLRQPGAEIGLLNDTPLADDVLSIPGIKVYTGKDALSRLADFDVIIKSPGVSPYRPELMDAKARGVYFTSATRLWFAEHPHAKTVCITGTKGKSTAAGLTACLLRHAGLRTALGGNIGMPVFDIPEDPAPDIWVLELSSYQTYDFDGFPSLSVLLNLFPEHLDWHGDTETYFRDKLNLLEPRRNGGIVLNRADETGAPRVGPGETGKTGQKRFYFNDAAGIHVTDDTIYEGACALAPADILKLPGRHNLSNLCAALTIVRALGIAPETCIDAVADFRALPHRLCLLGEKAGLRYVDDSISTIPQSAKAAVEAFPGQAVTILLGGYERGLPWAEVAGFMVARPVHAIISMGENGPRIAQMVRQAIETLAPAAPPHLYAAESLSHAVKLAGKTTPRGGVVLLSPGSPSYGEFLNFQERGKAFAEAAGLVQK